MKYSSVISLLLLLSSNVCVIYTRIIQTDEVQLSFLKTLQSELAFRTRQQQQHVEYKKKNVTPSYIVETTTGPIRGSIEVTDRDQTQYASFVGIPYAKPPLGELRFRAPLPVEPWTQVRDSVVEGNSCEWSEDCLVLNVFTPKIESGPVSSPKAVVVFVHGGAFMGGSSGTVGYNPRFFLDKDVLFASMNYRLGPLGFLSLQNEEVPGNAGLKDQVLALKWIKENIAKFGGDPERIMLFGQSAGSASVSYLHISPAAKGLFSSVILESGTTMQSWAYQEPDWAETHAFQLGWLLGCNATDTETDKQILLDCLREADPQTLSSLQLLGLTFHELWILHFFPFIPTLEPAVEGAIITKPPYEHYSTGDMNHVPIMLGFTTAEAMMVYPLFYYIDPFGLFSTFVGQDMSRFIPYELNITHSSPQAPELEQMIRDFYFDGDQITAQHHKDIVVIGTDTHFAIDIQRVALLLSKNSRSSIWNYRFSYEGPFNGKSGIVADVEGVPHSGELGYIFDQSWQPYDNFTRDSRPQLMIDQMTEMWSNFAKYGNPTPNTNGYVKVNWKPFTSDQHNYLEIGEELTLGQGAQSDRMKFWNGIYEKVDQTRPLPE